MKTDFVLTKQLQVLADAICGRMRQKGDEAITSKPMRRKELEAELLAYQDALAMLLVSGPPQPPTVYCALNVMNNPDRRAAADYMDQWIENGGKTM